MLVMKLISLSGLIIRDILKSYAKWKSSKYVAATPRLQSYGQMENELSKGHSLDQRLPTKLVIS